jgi:hypothetical protein
VSSAFERDIKYFWQHKGDEYYDWLTVHSQVSVLRSCFPCIAVKITVAVTVSPTVN